MESKKLRMIVALVMAAVMVCMAVSLSACGKKKEAPVEEPEQEQQEQEEEEQPEQVEPEDGPELSEDQMDDLYQQAAEFGWHDQQVDFLPDKIYGFAEPFSINRDGDKGTWYVYLCTAEYIALKDKAYNMSGAAGEAIIKFDYTDNGPKVTDVIWSADGGNHNKWIKKHFPKDALRNWKHYEPYDKDGTNKLMEIVDKKAEDDLGVPISDDLLEINDDGTYTISKVIESGDPADGTYTFDTEVIDSGKVKDLE